MLLLTFDLERMPAKELGMNGFKHLEFAYLQLHNNTCDLHYSIAPSKNINSEQIAFFKQVLIPPRHKSVFEKLDLQPNLSTYKGLMIIDQNEDFYQRFKDMTIYFQGIVSTTNLSPLNFIFHHQSFLNSDKPYEDFNTEGKKGVIKKITNETDDSYTGPRGEGKYKYMITEEFVQYAVSEYFKFGCNKLDYHNYVKFVKDDAITKTRARLEAVSKSNDISLCKYENSDSTQQTVAIFDFTDNARESCLAFGGTPYSESEIANKICETIPNHVFHENDLIKITCDNYQDLLEFNQTHITGIYMLESAQV